MPRANVRWTVAIFTGAVLLLLIPAPASSDRVTPIRAFSAILPRGPGKILVLKYCVGCHGANVARYRIEKGEWMEDWSFIEDPQEETHALAGYLEANFGVPLSGDNARKESPFANLLPAGPERDLIVEKCLLCHDRESAVRVIEPRLGFPATVWRSLLSRMNAYGALLEQDEIGRLSAFFEAQPVPKESPIREAGSSRRFGDLFPAGPGRDPLAAHCLSCHGTEELRKRMDDNSGAEPSYWPDVIRRMRQQWDVLLEDSDAKLIVDYLSTLAHRP